MLRFAFIINLLLFIVASGSANNKEWAGNFYAKPEMVAGVNKPSMSLNGKWQFRFDSKSKWTTIEVPGEAVMQGYGIKHDTPFFYKRTFVVPKDYSNKTVILRFDGVYGHAILYVNGKKVREHHGGFTRWEADVTHLVKAGKSNSVMLEVEDRLDDISYASGYAHHPIGGILRDVTVFALPKAHINNVKIDASLDSLYCNGELKLQGNCVGADGSTLHLQLCDAKGNCVASKTATLSSGNVVCTMPVANPAKWDAEHPNLYTLKVSVADANGITMQFVRKVGFRTIKVVGSRLMVNGNPVKLRGACRHDIHPTLGRTVTRQLDSLDVMLFKQSNMNFVRTSHYPPSENFIEFCDRYGIYVECESAVCFVNTHRQRNYAPAASSNDPAFEHKYLSQVHEMVSYFQHHPAVLIWSIGNESDYGSNFKASYDYIKQTDATRPVIYSYPGLAQKNGEKIYDILSMHYPGVEGNMEQYGMSTRAFQGHGIPALFDEWAHPACYTYATLRNDPNIREFWGKSLDLMWQGVFNSPGALGGAIWGYIDETFAVPQLKAGDAFWKEFARTAKPEGFRGDCVGYGEWGIVDVWRRDKPEFWATKKAYTPVKLLGTHIADFAAGQNLTLEVMNRFDHTCLNEVRATYTYKGKKGAAAMQPVKPHRKGVVTIPAQAWLQGDSLTLEFFTPDGIMVDSYVVTIGDAKINYPTGVTPGGLDVLNTAESITVNGNGFSVPFSKSTGLITNATVQGKTAIQCGPQLNVYVNYNHLSGPEVRSIADHLLLDTSSWRLVSINSTKGANGVTVAVKGTYSDVAVSLNYLITPAGEISIDYSAEGLPNGYIREYGLCFELPETTSWMQWQRRGYWDSYPEHSMSGNTGAADIYRSNQSAYGKEPSQPWAYDTHNYYYWSDAGANCTKPLTNMAKSMKENVHFYSLGSDKQARLLSVVSKDASVACRLNKTDDNRLQLIVDSKWDYPEIGWGDYCKMQEAVPYHGFIKLILQ
ncbi:MAG: glycoside hydrolase family 2 TIM barrel-domain containing protein [Muribaculaceae bacterium]